MLPIVPEGGHLYLQSDILHSLLKTKITDEIWSGRLIQYVRVFHQGPLIYTNGYVKIYNETDRPDRINRYFNITNPDCTDVKSITEVVVHGLKEGYYVQLNLDEYLIEKTYFSGRVHYCRNFLVYGFDDQKREIYAASHDRNTRYTVFVLTYKLLDEIYDAGIEGLPNQAHNRCQYIRLNDRLENDEAFQYSETKWKTDIERHLKDRVVSGADEDSVYTDLYGPSRFEAIFRALEQLKYNLEKTDYRIFIMLKNHLQVYASVLKKSGKYDYAQSIVKNLAEAFHTLDSLCLCMMKLFSDNRRNDILQFIQKRLSDIIAIEKEAATIWQEV